MILFICDRCGGWQQPKGSQAMLITNKKTGEQKCICETCYNQALTYRKVMEDAYKIYKKKLEEKKEST